MRLWSSILFTATGTWKIETAYKENGSSKIRTRLRLPLQDDVEDEVSLSIVLPSNYPHQRPEFRRVGEWNALPQRRRNICILMFLVIREIFEPGLVCMHDAIQLVAKQISFLNEPHDDIAASLADELQWMLWDDLDVSNIAAEATCTVCMDEDFAFRMAPLPCGFRYCMTCFYAGWDIAFSARKPYTCCLERVPVRLIKSRIQPDQDDMKRYTQVLLARDTAHPFSCGYFKNYGKLVGGFDKKALRLAASKRGGGGVLCRACGLWS
ncbi:hypothetical protein diail_10076 [Diaporthe ilicicola]|nr:hypothetical protein diail_10076 [Diaporthe ilicicola]